MPQRGIADKSDLKPSRMPEDGNGQHSPLLSGFAIANSPIAKDRRQSSPSINRWARFEEEARVPPVVSRRESGAGKTRSLSSKFRA